MTFDMADFSNCPGEGLFGGEYTASNSTSSGWMNMYSGTRLSVNTFYLQLEELTGVCAPFELAKQMGVQAHRPGAPSAIPSFTLGIADASPLEMAEAYATFAARGLHCASRPVTQILDSAGNVVKDYAPQCTQVMQQNVADAVSNVLRGVIEGGFASAQALSVAAAGKTGTTNEQKAVWFCGYTPHYAAAATIAGIDHFGTPDPARGQDRRRQPTSTRPPAPASPPRSGVTRSVLTAGLPYEDFVYPVGIEGVGQTAANRRRSRRRATGRRQRRWRGNGGGNGGGNGRAANGWRPRVARTGWTRSAQLAAYLRGDDATVGPALDLGLDDAHHLAHRLHALAGRAGLLDGGGDQRDDLLLGELLRQVVGDHRGLGTLLVGHLGPAAVVERGGSLAALLGLGRQDADHLVVGQLAGLLAGHLGVGDRGEHHPQRRRADRRRAP